MIQSTKTRAGVVKSAVKASESSAWEDSYGKPSRTAESSDAAERIEALRGAARRATVKFLESAPSRGHGSILIDDEGTSLVYGRIEREYGIFVEYPSGTRVALDKAKDKSLIDGCMRIRALYEEVCNNVRIDAERAENAIQEALDFVDHLGGGY